VAGHAAAAFAASAALLQKDDPAYAIEAIKSAYALYQFGTKHNVTASTWNVEVEKTYDTASSGQYLLYSASMIAWAHRCTDPTLPLCKELKARQWLAVAESQWQYQVVRSFSVFLSLRSWRGCCTCNVVAEDGGCSITFVLEIT
jgi:hypothetical protein